MFFDIGEYNEGFPVQIVYHNKVINLDKGWIIDSHGDGYLIYKGITQENFFKKSDIDDISKLEGNFCVITCKDKFITIDAGLRRKFPVFYNEHSISNLVSYKNYHDYRELKIDNITLCEDRQTSKYLDLNLSDEELFELLYTTIDNKINYFNTNLPFKFFPTGGVDTTALYSFLLKNNKEVELLTAEHTEVDYFLSHYRTELGKFWLYPDIHYYRNKTILLSGANGDEMMLRNPQDAYLMCKLYGENLLDLCKSNDGYHTKYYTKEKHFEGYKHIDSMTDLNELAVKEYILERNHCDYQFWHLGNTFTFTPLNDLNICNIMLNFSYETLRKQFLDGYISKKIIERNSPKLLEYVSDYKNENHFKKLATVFETGEFCL